MAATLDHLLDRRRDPSAPLITYYDVATGERTELSAVTAGNWIAKTANFLRDEADAEPGTRLRLALPTHWLRHVWMLASWTVGVTVTDDGPADLGLDGPDAAPATEAVRLVSALRPFGTRFPEPPVDAIDIGAEIPGHPDVFVPLDPPTPTTPALDVGGRALDHASLAATTPDPRRRLITPDSLERDAVRLVAACLGDGSLVAVAHGSADDLARIADQEGADRSAGAPPT